MKFFKNTGNVLILGFVVFAIGILFLIFKMMQFPNDLAVKGDYYQQELSYDAKLMATKAADGYGLAFKFQHDGNKITLTIPEELSEDLDYGEVEFFCLSNSKNDSKQTITSNTDGVYMFNRSEVAVGNNYIVKLSFESGGQKYYKEFRML